MNLKSLLIAGFFAMASVFCLAQNTLVDYKLIRVNATPDTVNVELQKLLAKEKSKLSKKTDVVIGYCPTAMERLMPQSPLPNFLTDLLVEFGNDFCADSNPNSIDFSLINYGGIRSNLPQGNITIGNLFEVSPFENFVVFVDIKGSELTKMLNRFRIKKCEFLSKDIEMVYLGDYVHEIFFRGQKIEPDRIYRFATLDFILTGGDGILKGIQLEGSYDTKVVARDMFIRFIKEMTANGKEITGKIDGRVKVLPQN